MKYLILILITLTFISCGGKSYTYLADHIFTAYGKEMKKKRGYWLEGTGGSMPNDDVRSFFMSFEGMREVDIPEARRLYVEVVEGLLKRVNCDETIRPYLHDYPSISKNTRIHLGFIDRNKNPVAENHIAFVFLVDGIICYSIYNPRIPDFEIVYEEPYEEALKIVQDEQHQL